MKSTIPIEIITKVFEDIATDKEKQLLDNWIALSKENKQQFDELQTIWNISGNIRFKPSFNVDSALSKVSTQIYSKKTIKLESTRTNLAFVFKIAASFLFIITISILLYINSPLNYITAQTTDNKIELILADGTKIWLNKHSIFRYPKHFKGKSRTVFLSGEAYFKVAKDSLHPFIIKASKTETRVIGTEFNIKAISDSMLVKVNVTEGKVSFSANKEKVILTVGDVGILNKTTKSIIKSKNTDPNYMAWKTGKIIFEKASIYQIAHTISNYYGINIAISKEIKDTINYNATFENTNLKDILKTIEITLNIKIDSSASQYVIQSN